MQGKTTDQLRGSWHNFSKYRPLIRELVTRDLKVKYRRSFLGYVWSILNPLLMMLLQTLVFSWCPALLTCCSVWRLSFWSCSSPARPST